MKMNIALIGAPLLLAACTQTAQPHAIEGNPLAQEVIADATIDYVTNLQIRASERGEPLTDPAILRAIDAAFVGERKRAKRAHEKQDEGKHGVFYGVNDNRATGETLLLPGVLYTGYEFEVSAAPGMRVYLATHVSPRTKEELFGESTIDLGELRSIIGAQAYAVRAMSGDEWNRYRTVAIYSGPLTSVIALAQIRPMIQGDE